MSTTNTAATTQDAQSIQSTQELERELSFHQVMEKYPYGLKIQNIKNENNEYCIQNDTSKAWVLVLSIEGGSGGLNLTPRQVFGNWWKDGGGGRQELHSYTQQGAHGNVVNILLDDVLKIVGTYGRGNLSNVRFKEQTRRNGSSMSYFDKGWGILDNAFKVQQAPQSIHHLIFNRNSKLTIRFIYNGASNAVQKGRVFLHWAEREKALGRNMIYAQ